MNLQQLFTMSVKSARRFLDRWNAWVQVCDLAPIEAANHHAKSKHPQIDPTTFKWVSRNLAG